MCKLNLNKKWEKYETGELSTSEIFSLEEHFNKKIKFWKKWDDNRVFTSFFTNIIISVIFLLLGVSIKDSFPLAILAINSVSTYSVPFFIMCKYQKNLDVIKYTKFNLARNIENICQNHIELEVAPILDQVIQNCFEKKPEVSDVLNMTENLVKEARSTSKQNMRKPLLLRDYNLSLSDLYIIKRWLVEYTNECPDVDKIANITQWMVETKLLEYPIEVAEKHLENQEYVKTYKL